MTIEEYLAELGRHLRVGPIAKRRILREIAAHLEQARDAAEVDLVARFGDPAAIAAAFERRHVRWAPAGVGILLAAGGAALAVVVPSVFTSHQSAAGPVARGHACPWKTHAISCTVSPDGTVQKMYAANGARALGSNRAVTFTISADATSCVQPPPTQAVTITDEFGTGIEGVIAGNDCSP